MHAPDASFSTHNGLNTALELLASPRRDAADLPVMLPETGLGEIRALELLSGHVLDRAAQLGSPTSLGYMDPPLLAKTRASSIVSAVPLPSSFAPGASAL